MPTPAPPLWRTRAGILCDSILSLTHSLSRALSLARSLSRSLSRVLSLSLSLSRALPLALDLARSRSLYLAFAHTLSSANPGAGGVWFSVFNTRIHPGVELMENLESISHRYYLEEVVFVWELTKKSMHSPLGCLQGCSCSLSGNASSQQ